MATKKKARNPKLVGSKREREAALAAEADAMTAPDAPAVDIDAADETDDDITTLTKKVTRIVRDVTRKPNVRGITAEAAAEIAQSAPVPAPRSHAILFAQKASAKSAAIGRVLAQEAKRRGHRVERAGSRETALRSRKR